MTAIDPEQQRAVSRELWERAAAGWGKNADRVRDWGMPVSAAMVARLGLRPGQRVLELAAGPGDTGFMAAELIRPGGTLVCSDGAETMLEVARRRAEQAGIANVEFAQLELEWIDLPAASVDAVLCRWGIMLIVDPDAAAREVRRVLRPGGRAAFAVWDSPERNPWATIPTGVLAELGHTRPPEPDAPGMFSLAPEGRLQELLEAGGFTQVQIEPVAIDRRFADLDAFVEETREMSPTFTSTFQALSEAEQRAVLERVSAGAADFRAADGSVRLPGSSLVAVASG